VVQLAKDESRSHNGLAQVNDDPGRGEGELGLDSSIDTAGEFLFVGSRRSKRDRPERLTGSISRSRGAVGTPRKARSEFASSISIDGKTFPAIPILMAREGDRVPNTNIDTSHSIHPMYLHGHHVLVLSKHGYPI